MAMRGGRPTKLKPKLQQAYCHAISLGAPVELAAMYAGIDRKQIWRWRERGERETRGIYHDFVEAEKVAQAHGVVGCLATIKHASLDQWQAAAWLLERRYPEQYGRTHVRIDGELRSEHRETNVNVNLSMDLGRLSVDELQQVRALLAKALGSEPGVSHLSGSGTSGAESGGNGVSDAEPR